MLFALEFVLSTSNLAVTVRGRVPCSPVPNALALIVQLTCVRVGPLCIMTRTGPAAATAGVMLLKTRGRGALPQMSVGPKRHTPRTTRLDSGITAPQARTGPRTLLFQIPLSEAH